MSAFPLSWSQLDDALMAGDECDGAPFKWDEEDRRHRLSRLDALFFNLYGIDRSDAALLFRYFSIHHAP